MPSSGRPWVAIALAALAHAGTAHAQTPQGTTFTYQGRLTDAGLPAEGAFDFQFRLFDSVTGGTQSGPTVLRDDVPVTGGLFTVALDFGAAFAGSKRFLDVGVRPAASTGGYVGLAPRQELTSGPTALWSAAGPWSGVAGKPAGFADDTDNDVLGGLACGSGAVAKWNGNAWTCAADANSGGTVTSIASGAGLTGGPVTGTGTLAVASGGITTPLLASQSVTSPKIANGAVGLAQIDTAQVQARIGGSCGAGQYLRGINADGSVACEAVFVAPSVLTVDDPANLVGSSTSIATGADGLPVVSYHDATAGALKLLRCGNLACSAGNVAVTVDDPAAVVGLDTSIAVPADGLPVISYHDQTGGALKVAKCASAGCNSSTRTFVDDPAVNVVGRGSSLAIGTDGLPVISYLDTTAGTLKVVKCGNAACSNANTITVVDDPSGVLARDTAIAIGADGRPVVSYYDQTAGSLEVAHCGNAACTAGNVLTTVDDPADPNAVAGFDSSIAIGADGLPVVSYTQQVITTLSLKVAKCASAACTGAATLTVLSSDLGGAGDLVIGADGLPLVTFYSSSITGLRVAKCGNASCGAGTLLTSLDGPPPGGGFLGTDSSVVLGSDGLPVISYATSLGTLKVAKCSTQSCR